MVFFEKSQPAPVCLATEKTKSSGDYKCGDVLSRLRDDFGDKCYICEAKGLTGVNVEHFMSHQGDKDLKFDWNNLFWSCVHCNGIKSTKYNNLLNCTKAEDDVELRVKCSINPFPKEKVKLESLDNNPRTLETKELLDKVYNGKETTELKRMQADVLRSNILKEIKEFQELLFDYFDKLNDEEEKMSYFNKIKKKLKRASAFASFKRWIVRDNETLKNEFEQYCD